MFSRRTPVLCWMRESVLPNNRIRLIVNNCKVCDYVCDFRLRYADGRKELVECKGMWTDAANIARALL